MTDTVPILHYGRGAPSVATRPLVSAGVEHRHRATSQSAAAPVASSEWPLGAGEKRVMIAIAQYPDGADREQLTILTGYKRSSRNTYLQRLQAAGLIEARGENLIATDEGMAALGSDFEPLPTGAELRDYWLGRLPEGERKILSELIDLYPDAADRETVGASAGYKRSSRNTYIQRLGARKLVENVGRGEIRAAAMLFED